MKLPNIFRRSHSLANRLTWRVVGVTTLVFTLLSIVFFIILWLAGSMLMSAVYYAEVNVANEKINNIFSNVEVALTNNVPEVEENIDNDKRQYYAVEHLLELNPTIVGAAVAYNPDYEPKKGIAFSPYAYRDSLGIHNKQLNTETYDYLHQEWYTTPIEEGKSFWSEPYIDKGGADIPMITYSLPLTNNKGEIYAIQTADIALDWLADVCKEQDDELNDNFSFLTGNDSTSRAYSFIITHRGNFVAHPNNSLVVVENLKSYLEKDGEFSSYDARLTNALLDDHDDNGIQLFRDKNKNRYIIYYATISRTKWVMVVAVPLKTIIHPVNMFVMCLVAAMLISLIIVSLVCRRNIRRITNPLSSFADSADEISKGNFRAELPRIKSNDEMLRLRNSFETMQQSLIKQIEETKIINEEKGRMESELQIACDIQMSMLPKTFPPFPDRKDIDIYAQLIPAKEVGGDLYDFFIRDEKLYFCIGDGSGKGVPAALMMAVVRALFHSISAHESHPSKIISIINDSMVESNESDMFVTLFIGVLDLPTGKLRYSNAGHNPPMMIGDDITMLPVTPNLPLGIKKDWKYNTQETTIAPGTMLFLYTDGLTEAEDINHEQFQEQRIINVATNSLHQPHQLIRNMMQAVDAFVSIAERSDDLTMLAIQYTKQQLDVRLQRSITLPNDVEQVPLLAEFVDEVCEAVGFDMSVTMSLNLALEEAVVNVMTYAYPAGTQGNVTIEALANEERLKFIISDNGTPFDPTAKEDADTTLSAEERPIGGLGIHLVRQIMDSINYERTDGKNVLTLRKKLVS